MDSAPAKEYLPPKEYLFIAFTYGVSVAALYLFGFWGVFHINVLEFISLADIAKLAIYPLLYSLPVFLLGFTIGQVFTGDAFPPGGGAGTKVGQFGLKHWRFLLGLNIVLTLVVMIFVPYPIRFLLLLPLAGFLSIAATHLNIAMVYIPNPVARRTILTLLFIAPVLAFDSGETAARKIKHGLGDLNVDTLRSKIELSFTDEKPVSYVGYLGDFMVLYETATDRVVFVKLKDQGALVLYSKR